MGVAETVVEVVVALGVVAAVAMLEVQLIDVDVAAAVAVDGVAVP